MNQRSRQDLNATASKQVTPLTNTEVQRSTKTIPPKSLTRQKDKLASRNFNSQNQLKEVAAVGASIKFLHQSPSKTSLNMKESNQKTPAITSAQSKNKIGARTELNKQESKFSLAHQTRKNFGTGSMPTQMQKNQVPTLRVNNSSNVANHRLKISHQPPNLEKHSSVPKTTKSILSGPEFSPKKKKDLQVGFQASAHGSEDGDEFDQENSDDKSAPTQSVLELDDVASRPQKPSVYQGSPSNRGSFIPDFSPGSRLKKMQKAQSCATSKLKSPKEYMKKLARDKDKIHDKFNPVYSPGDNDSFESSSLTGTRNDRQIMVVNEDTSNSMCFSGDREKPLIINKPLNRDFNIGQSQQNLFVPKVVGLGPMRRDQSQPAKKSKVTVQAAQLEPHIEEYDDYSFVVKSKKKTTSKCTMSKTKSQRVIRRKDQQALNNDNSNRNSVTISKQISKDMNQGSSFRQSNVQAVQIMEYDDKKRKSAANKSNVDFDEESLLKDTSPTPRTAREAIEIKYIKKIAEIKRRVEAHELPMNGFAKRQQKLYDEKEKELHQVEMAKQIKQFKKEKALKRQSLQVPGLKLAHTPDPNLKHHKNAKSFASHNESSQNLNHKVMTSKYNSQSQPNFLMQSFQVGQNTTLDSSKILNRLSYQSTTQVNLSTTRDLKSTFPALQSVEVTVIGGQSNQRRSSLFQTMDSQHKYSLQEPDMHKRGHTHVSILTLDKEELANFQKQKKIDQMHQVRNKSVPTASILEDLQDTGIDQKIPDHENPLGKRRKLKKRQAGSSLPKTLIFKDRDGELFNHKTSAGTSYRQSEPVSKPRILKLGEETRKHNKFLSQLQSQLTMGKNNAYQKQEETVQKKPQKFASTNIDTEILSQQITSYSEADLEESQTKRKKKKITTTFESKVRAVAIEGGSNNEVNTKIMKLIQAQEMTKLPDFAKTSLKAESTEIKTLQHELSSCMNQQNMIRILETAPANATTNEIIKNEDIELIPRLPIQFKVSIKERIAPIRFKFEFFDSNGVKMNKPDTAVYLSPTQQNPTLQKCHLAKTDFKDPFIVMYRELQGRTFPELHPSNKIDKFPQQIYLSVVSIMGCFCTITVSFPLEKKAIEYKMTKQPAIKLRTQQTQLSKEEKNFQDFQDIDYDLKTRRLYVQTYKRKKKFVDEEIKRCTDKNNAYSPQILKEEKNLSKKRRQQREKFIQSYETKNQKEKDKCMQHWVDRKAIYNKSSLGTRSHSQISLRKDQNVDLDMLKHKQTLIQNGKATQEQKLNQQSDMLSIKTELAKKKRDQLFKEKRRFNQLNIIKQDLLRERKGKQIAITKEQIEIRRKAQQSVQRIKSWFILKQIFEKFERNKQDTRYRKIQHNSSMLIVRCAIRFFNEKDKYGRLVFGRTMKDRMQKKFSTACLFISAMLWYKAPPAGEELQTELSLTSDKAPITGLEATYGVYRHAQVIFERFTEKIAMVMTFKSKTAIFAATVEKLQLEWHKQYSQHFISSSKHFIPPRFILLDFYVKNWSKLDKIPKMKSIAKCSYLEKFPKSIELNFAEDRKSDIFKENCVNFSKILKLKMKIRRFKTNTALNKLRAERNLQLIEQKIQALVSTSDLKEDEDSKKLESKEILTETPNDSTPIHTVTLVAQPDEIMRKFELNTLENERSEQKAKIEQYTKWLQQSDSNSVREQLKKNYQAERAKQMLLHNDESKLNKRQPDEICSNQLISLRKQYEESITWQYSGSKKKKENFPLSSIKSGLLVCWRGNYGYEKIESNIKAFKSFNKKGTKLDKAERLAKFLKKQAELIRTNFVAWNVKRDKEFEQSLNEQIQQFKKLPLDQDLPLLKVNKFTSVFYPEELSYLFLRIMQDINKHDEKSTTGKLNKEKDKERKNSFILPQKDQSAQQAQNNVDCLTENCHQLE